VLLCEPASAPVLMLRASLIYEPLVTLLLVPYFLCIICLI
jgi:hypothetical protein